MNFNLILNSFNLKPFNVNTHYHRSTPNIADPSCVPPLAALPVADESAESGKRRDGEGRKEGSSNPERGAQRAVSIAIDNNQYVDKIILCCQFI